MRAYRKICCAAFLTSLALVAGRVVGMSQDLAGFTLQAPPNTVQLINAAPDAHGGWRLTLKNVSSKPIVECEIGSVSSKNSADENLAGFETFSVGGTGAFQPGATEDVTFSPYADSQEVRLEAIVWSDGSHDGNPKWLRELEDTMIGMTLETKRIADVFEGSTDRSLGAAEPIRDKVGRRPPHSPSEAGQSLQDVDLPGVSRSYLDEHRNSPSVGFQHGVSQARQGALSEINEQARRAGTPGYSKAAADFANDAKNNAFTNLAATFRARNAAQIEILKGFAQKDGR
jgi:hypothetical protein